MMKRSLFLIFGLILNLLVYSHPWKPSHYVIVDTDGGIDDMKAITMLLASPDVRVLAVTVSPGALSREKAYIKIKSLLNSFYHEGIPVGINKSSEFKSPDFKIPLNAIWGDETGIDPGKAPDCFYIINDILSHEKTKISFLCLGGMATAEFAIKNIPLFRNQVKEIIWSSNGLTDTSGFNYNIDPESSSEVLKGEIPVIAVRGFGQEKLLNETLLEEISGLNTKYGEKFYGLFRSEFAKRHEFLYFLTDETAVLYLQYPEYFKNDTSGINSECSPLQKEMLRQGIVRMLKGETASKNQVIKELPVYPEFYFDDIKPSVNEIIARYGIDEWTSGVIANELHRHLGVFAIIGVKMGIRAREYFNTGVDEFSATSFAGSMPPLSCMNDGVQVSTGATPGHGLLKVRNDTAAAASAEFVYMNRKIRLTLKPEIAGKIISELKEINFVYGLDSNIYWELVRKNSIKYWSVLDRHVIFLIEELY